MAERPAIWLVERGIGEHRAIRLEQGSPVAARILWPGNLTPGQVEDATLVAKPRGSTRGRARFASGEEALVDRLAGNASEGAPIRLLVTRAAVSEAARGKLAQARPIEADLRPAPSLAEWLTDGGDEVREVDRFAGDDWEGIWSDAWLGTRIFPGGALHFYPAPAMTLIDVDGVLPPRELALAAVPPVAETLELFGIGGSVGIDFPTLQAKEDRKSVDLALAEALAARDGERTAMNGFGFVQLVSRVGLPSLLHRLAQDRVGAAARLLLRRALHSIGPGRILELHAHPSVQTAIRQDWIEAAERRSGKTLRMVSNPALALESGFAQAVDA